MTARILVAGIGNVLLGDDGFGVEVAQRLQRRPIGDDVRVVDFGIRGFDLTYALLEPWDAAILVDATARGGAPGTLYVIEPALADAGAAAIVETHGMDPMRVLAVVRSMGGALERLRVVGCEPACLGDGDEPLMGLSPAVEAAIDPAIALVEKLVAEARHA
ncbi:MAG TPA: hydrogenase maturation protease [Polyangia bacterium]|nr:hydrogenase maturation protease [Polyangia bacterium]